MAEKKETQTQKAPAKRFPGKDSCKLLAGGENTWL
jgi:hypothetical protein